MPPLQHCRERHGLRLTDSRADGRDYSENF